MVRDNFEVPSSAVERAQEIRANLDVQYPSFVKIMLHSHVTKVFWLGIPTAFCRMYLPDRDALFILEDEEGKEYEAKYIASRTGLSGGWRRFAVEHNLLEGDAVVYHLVETYKFKVLIVRGTNQSEVDGAIGLLELDRNLRDTKSGEVTKEKGKRREKTRKRKVYLEEEEECERSTSFVDFADFSIIVSGINLDYHIPESVRLKYYELCRAQKSYLHGGLLETLSSASAADIICDTVKVADAIKSSNIYTPQSDFTICDKTLSGFEFLGIELGFLRARITKLAGLAEQLGDTPRVKRYQQAKLQINLAEEEVKTLEARLQEAQQVKMRCTSDIKLLKKYLNRDEIMFLEEAKAPW
ncbi:OLC1v1008311C2 [Oldenlandia corymbosa var. corymbosa]|uniref:OLC1v1008311C2 n=1 Tax=Oldenlandia corymbosa var. corymbosa TaxID=529605 RepID=A0AAV1DNR8_OLDCO|nr:OLC1v1008311C2 [Oldenlandia corymbosa var. corymbosa]